MEKNLERNGRRLIEVLPRNLFGESEKIHETPVRIITVASEIRIERLPNPIPECYSQTNMSVKFCDINHLFRKMGLLRIFYKCG